MTMHNLGEVRTALAAGELDEALARLMCGDPAPGRQRVTQLLDGFQRTFGGGEDTPVTLCSAPGRTEICGNHTDHQHGRVLAAAVNLDFSACAAPNGTNTIRFQSEGWPLVEVELDTLEPKEEEKESTAALVRGMAAQAARRGYPVAGFDAYALSDVLPGSGLSSSAACEVLLGVIENHLFCRDELTAVEIAQMGQKAENLYFGKQSGLMDQTASSVGGAVAIDFADPAAPVVRSVAVDLNALGYTPCALWTRGPATPPSPASMIPSPRRCGRWPPSSARTCCGRRMRPRCSPSCPSCGRRRETGRSSGPSTSLPTTGARSRRPTPWSGATWTPSWPWWSSRAAPPGSCFRTSPPPGRSRSRPWPWP